MLLRLRVPLGSEQTVLLRHPGHQLAAKVGIAHPWRDRWIVDGSYRWYDQSAADSRFDMFPRSNAQRFPARDQELSTFASHTPSIGASYTLPPLGLMERARRRVR